MTNNQKPDNGKQKFNRRKKRFSRRTFFIVRSLFYIFLLLQQRGFPLSGFCPRTPSKIKKNKDLLLIIYNLLELLHSNNSLLFLNKELFSLREKKSNVRFYIKKNLTLKRVFFHFSLSGFKHYLLAIMPFFHCFSRDFSVLSCLRFLMYIVRFLQSGILTFRNCIVRFYIKKNLTGNEGLYGYSW